MYGQKCVSGGGTLKKYLKLYFSSILFLSLMLSGCGGGGGSSSNQNTNTEDSSSFSGVAQLGYISGATVNLYNKNNLNKKIASTKTSTSTDKNQAGSFTFKNIVINKSKYYVLEVIGGEDIDINDDGVIDTTTKIALKGKIYSLAKGENLLENRLRITALSDMAYQKIKNGLASLDNTKIKEFLDKNAKEYLYDVNKDGIVSNKDILEFNPIQNRDKTKKSYKDILNIYVSKLHQGLDEDKILSSLMYLDKPRIVVQNGTLQEVPFNLKASVENIPSNLRVKWKLNHQDKTSIDEQISKDGIYQINAKIYKNDKLLKTINTSVVATKKIEIASLNVDTKKDSIVYVKDDSNSSLAGTKIIVLKGALKEDVKITVKKASINHIPNTNAMGISDILVLEPSGLSFDKPVVVRMPYDKNIDLKNQQVRVARYSKGGKVDYIQPLFIDKENHEIVFETEHFTEFKLETNIFYVTKSKSEQKEINDIENLTGLSYSLDEWEQVLNTKLFGSDFFTVYDLYLQYKLKKDLDKKIQEDKYREAYQDFFKDETLISSTNIILNDVKNNYETFKDTKDDIGIVSDGIDALLTKKYFDFIGSTLGLNLDMNPMNFVTRYTTYIFEQGYKALAQLENTAMNEQIEAYFNARRSNKKLNHEDILWELHYSKGSNEISSNYNIYFKNGWFYDSGYEFLKITNSEPPEGFWQRIGVLYDMINNFNKKSDEEHRNGLKDIISSTKEYLEYPERLEYAQKNPRIVGFDYTASFKEKLVIYNEKDKRISLKSRLSFYGYKDDPSFKIDITDMNNVSLIDEKIPFDCVLGGSTNDIYRGCTVEVEINTDKVEGKKLVKLRLYDTNDKYLDEQDSIPLRKQPKVEVDVSVEFDEYSRSHFGWYTARVKANFKPYKVPHNITVYLGDKRIGSGGRINIYKSDLSSKNISNIEIIVDPQEAYTDSSYFPKLSFIRDISDDIIPKLKIVKVNDKDVDNVDTVININDKVTFLTKGLDIESIKDKELLKGECVFSPRPLRYYMINCTYKKPLSFTPSMLIVKHDKTETKIEAPKLTVQEKVENKTCKDDNYNCPVCKDNEVLKYQDDGSGYCEAKNIDEPEPTEENHKPIAKAKTYTINQDTTLDITLEASDEDGDTLSYEIGTPKHGKLEGTAPNLRYTPNSGFSGTDTFAFKVFDGKEWSILRLITINIKKEEAPIEAKITSLSPKSVNLNESTTFTILGENLPDTIVMTLQDGEREAVNYISSLKATILCTPKASGQKDFYIKNKSQGEAINSEVILKVQVDTSTPSISSSEFLGTLATGQTKSYQDGDDGYYQKGRTRNFTRGSGIVTDHLTGLQWQNEYPNNNGEVAKKSWVTQANWNAYNYDDTSGDTATTYCQNLELGGYSDWRLPSVDELLSILDNGKYDPIISNIFKKTTSENYWSSTSFASDTYYAWVVDFYSGYTYYYYKRYSYYVRCVRAGQ